MKERKGIFLIEMRSTNCRLAWKRNSDIDSLDIRFTLPSGGSCYWEVRRGTNTTAPGAFGDTSYVMEEAIRMMHDITPNQVVQEVSRSPQKRIQQ
jgi:hypothetical protein